VFSKEEILNTRSHCKIVKSIFHGYYFQFMLTAIGGLVSKIGEPDD